MLWAIHLSSVCLSACLSACLCLSVCLSVCVCQSVCVSVSVCQSVSVCLSVCQSVCLCLSICLSVCLSACLSVSLSVLSVICDVVSPLSYTNNNNKPTQNLKLFSNILHHFAQFSLWTFCSQERKVRRSKWRLMSHSMWNGGTAIWVTVSKLHENLMAYLWTCL